MTNNSGKIIVKTLLGLGFCLVLILIGAGIFRNFLQKQMVNREVQSLQQEISQLEKGNKELTSLIDYLKTANFIESEARNKFGLAKSGEKVLVIAAGEAAGKTGEAASVTAPGDQKTAGAAGPAPANPVKWWQYFWTGNTLAQAPE